MNQFFFARHSALAATTTVVLFWFMGCGAATSPISASHPDGAAPNSSTASSTGAATSMSAATGSSTSTGTSATSSMGSGSSAASSAAGTSSGIVDASFDVVRPADPCIEAGSCAPGTWVDVTPPNASLTAGSCGNYGVKTVQVDPLHPQDMYALIFCQGIWKSTDYGQTWGSGPISTGMNGATMSDCAGGVTLAPSPTGGAPTLYVSCIRGAGLGFWKSTNGGIDWTTYPLAPMGATHFDPEPFSAMDYYPATVDPYDPNHLLMSGHQVDLVIESMDGGQTWTKVTLDLPAMALSGGTAMLYFIDNGDPVATRKTWLWLGALNGGTWRTTDSGTTWTQVDLNQHINGTMQIYQPDKTSGVIFIAGTNSALGDGVLRSADYGVTWTHLGNNEPEAIVFGTSKNVYAMYGWAIGAGQTTDPSLQVAPQPATTNWMKGMTPTSMSQGPAMAAVTNDGTNNVIVVAGYSAGLWRYIEP